MAGSIHITKEKTVSGKERWVVKRGQTVISTHSTRKDAEIHQRKHR